MVTGSDSGKRWRRGMAADLVTAEQYPDMDTFELTSELG